MDANMEGFIEDKVNAAFGEHKTEMLEEIENLFTKISGQTNAQQISKISTLVSGQEKFKRKSNEEQFRYNANVSVKLDESTHLLENGKMQEFRQKLAEVQSIISHRQKLIKLADSSDLGWRVVQEYQANPLASDSDDEKKIYKAEMRANKKLKAEKAKKTKATYRPYGTRHSAGQQSRGYNSSTVQSPVATTSQPRRLPGYSTRIVKGQYDISQLIKATFK